MDSTANSLQMASNANGNENNAANSNDHKIVEFIKDLKEAILSGNFQSNEALLNNIQIYQQYQQKNQQLQQQQQQNQQLQYIQQQINGSGYNLTGNNSLSNVNNLSNQTFSYIVNWLKHQQLQIEDPKEKDSIHIHEKNYGKHGANICWPIEQSDLNVDSEEIKILRNQLGYNEREKDRLCSQLKEFQLENLDLKTKLINLNDKTSTSPVSLPGNSYIQANAKFYMSQNHGNGSFLLANCDKDFEIDRLRRMIDDLIKSNEEKDKKIDELTKQVVRFKRIQEIVLSTQSAFAGSNSSKFKNLNDFETDSNCESNGNGSNNYSLISNSNMIDDSLLTQANASNYMASMTKNSNTLQQQKQQQQQQQQQLQQQHQQNQNKTIAKQFQQAPSPSQSMTPSNVVQPPAQLPQTSTTSSSSSSHQHQAAQNINAIQQSSSLTSSLSSTSSSSSSSSSHSSTQSASSSSAPTQLQKKEHQQAKTPTNQPITVAPLATISELVGYSSSNSNTNLVVGVDSHNGHAATSNEVKNNPNQLNVMLNANTSRQVTPGQAQVQAASSSSMRLMNPPNVFNLVGSINNNESKTGAENRFNSSSLSNKFASGISAKNSSLLSQSLMLSNNGDTRSNVGETGPKSSKGFRSFFGKLIRTSLVNINDANLSLSPNKNLTLKDSMTSSTCDTSTVAPNKNNNATSTSGTGIFKRGGKRATANARLQNFSFSNGSLLNGDSKSSFLRNSCSPMKGKQSKNEGPPIDLDTLAFAKWTSEQVYEWLKQNGFDFTGTDAGHASKWIKNGLHLLQASSNDFEKELGLKHPLHRKRLTLLLQSLYATTATSEDSASMVTSAENHFINFVDHHWVMKWLDDIGLPQYKDSFNEAKIDGRMLYHLNSEDLLLSLNINSELHYLSVKRAIHVLRLNNFDTQCLRRRPSGDEELDRSEVMLWTNHRIMEWLRSIDLSEYAPNLRGSGVHGGLMMFEPRFTATVLADILSIPANKTLLRRHLNTLFADLIGPQMCQMKKDAESQTGYQPLNASNKLKSHAKRSIGLFSSHHKRTKSQDSKDFLLTNSMNEFFTSPVHRILTANHYNHQSNSMHPHQSLAGNLMLNKPKYLTLQSNNNVNINNIKNGTNQSDNLNASGRTKLSFLNIAQDAPASVV